MENGKSGKKRGRKKKNIVPINFEKVDTVVKINSESLKKDYDDDDTPNKSGKNVQSSNFAFGGLNIKKVSVKHNNNTDEPKDYMNFLNSIERDISVQNGTTNNNNPNSPKNTKKGNNKCTTQSGDKKNGTYEHIYDEMVNNKLYNVHKKILIPESEYSIKGIQGNFDKCDEQIKCWWCCHDIDEYPYHTPFEYDDSTDSYFLEGYFCSINCAKAHILTQRSLIPLFNSFYKKMGIFNIEKIEPSPPKYLLKVFGGNLDYTEYKQQSDNGITYKTIIPNSKFLPTIFEQFKKNHNSISKDTRKYTLSRKNKPIYDNDNIFKDFIRKKN